MVANTPFANSRAIKSLARISSFSARSLTLTPSVMVMFRVIGNGSFESDKPRRRSIALHRAFFYSSRNVTLTRTARRPTRTAARTRWPWRRKPWAYANRTRSGWAPAAWDASADVRPDAAADGAGSSRGWAWTLKNWLSGHWPPGAGRPDIGRIG